MKNYKINYIENTITITAEFHEKMSNPNSEEYALIKQLLADFPKMKIVSKTHRTPTHYHNSNGEITSRNQFKNVSYENMERFMKALPDNEKFFAEYDFLRGSASNLQINGYSLIRKWFMTQFPKFRSNPLFYLSNVIELIPASKIIEQQAVEKKAS